MTVHLVIPDPHAKPGHHNKRAEWVGRLINDLKPDVVINLGDTADMPSLSSYDRGTKAFQGRTYQADIEAHGDFQDRLWSTVRKSKKRMPLRVTLIGNHEQRIERAVNVQPELEGVISYDDLELDKWYDVVVPYEGSTPGSVEIDGVTYAHYLVSGVACRAISGENLGAALIAKKHSSCTVGHNHTFDYAIRTRANGKKIMGLCAGVFQDYKAPFAGEANKLWHPGVVIKRNVEGGVYDIQTVSLAQLKREYGGG